MALSGTINGSVTNKSNYFSFYITWSATQSVSGNYSDVTVKTYWKTTNTTYGNFDTVGKRDASITIDGTKASISKVFEVYWSKVGNPYLIQTATQRIYHNGDGTKSITISARANGCASSYGPSSTTASSGDCTASGTITLDTIPRSSTITSAADITLGNTCNVKWTPASQDFKYKLTFSLGDWSYTTGFISPATTSAYTYTGYIISGTTSMNNTTIYAQLPSDPKGTMTATLTTYNSSNVQIGSSDSETFTVHVPSTVVPTVGTITLNPVNITTSDGISRDILVKGKNKLTISVSGCSAGIGSSIKSYTFSGPGISSTTTSTSVTSSSNISSTGTLTYTVKVTDNRGRTAYKTATITCYDYTAPSFTSFNAYRVASSTSTTANDGGSYVRCVYGVSYAPVDNESNNVDIKVFYKKNSSTSWLSNVAATDSTDVSGSKTLSGIDAASTYTVYATITDNYGTTISSSEITIFGESRIMNIRPGGSGIAFGKMAEEDDLFESKWPAKFDGGAEFIGDVTFSGNVYGLPEADEYVLPTASTSTLGGVKVDGSTVTINNGVISAKQYSLPTATTSTLGGVKVDGSTITTSSGVISAAKQSSISAIATYASGTTATSCSFTPANYDILLMGLTPSSSGAICIATIPAAVASSGLHFQVADESSYTTWDLSSTGLARDDGAGNIRYIYGVKL